LLKRPKRREPRVLLDRIDEVGSSRIRIQVRNPLLHRSKVPVQHNGGAVTPPKVKVRPPRKSLYRLGKLLLNLTIEALTLIPIPRFNQDMRVIAHKKVVYERHFMVPLYPRKYTFNNLLHVRRRHKG
jgi:hypothetical protein